MHALNQRVWTLMQTALMPMVVTILIWTLILDFNRNILYTIRSFVINFLPASYYSE